MKLYFVSWPFLTSCPSRLFDSESSWLADPVGSQGGDSFGSSSSVQISRVGPAPRHSKRAQSWAPKPPHKSKKEAGSCSSAVVTKSWSQSSLCWHFTHLFHIHGTLYASDSISETMIDCWLLGCPLVHISSYCLISHLYGATLPLSPFPWQRLHLLLYPFRKMFALFYWWLRGI